MADYQFKYLPPPVPRAGREPHPGADRMLQRMDELLYALLQERGEFFAFNVAFLVEIRMFNATLDETKSLQNSRFTGAYLVKVLKERFGEKEYGAVLTQLIEESERISNEVIQA